MTAYVVKSWNVSREEDVNGNLVEIKGRAPGLLSWILSLMGIEPTVSIYLSRKNITIESGSWSGRFYKTIPLAKVSSVYYGYAKPWKEALSIFFVLGVLLGVPTAGIMTIVGAIVSLIYYFLGKKLTLGVYEIGGGAFGINMKRSVIEGKRLDEKDAEKVGDLILELIGTKND